MSPSAEPSCSKHSELTGVGEWQSWGCRDIATGRWMAARRRAARPRDHPVAAPPHAAASFLGFTFFFFSFFFSFFFFSLFEGGGKSRRARKTRSPLGVLFSAL